MLTIPDATGKAFIWTQVESDVGIICCCLPMLKAWTTKYVPSIFGKGSGNSSNAYRMGYVNDRSNLSNKWKNPNNIQSRAIYDADATSSQEEIMGIKRTVNVSVTARGVDNNKGVAQFTQYPITEIV